MSRKWRGITPHECALVFEQLQLLEEAGADIGPREPLRIAGNLMEKAWAICHDDGFWAPLPEVIDDVPKIVFRSSFKRHLQSLL